MGSFMGHPFLLCNRRADFQGLLGPELSLHLCDRLHVSHQFFKKLWCPCCHLAPALLPKTFFFLSFSLWVANTLPIDIALLPPPKTFLKLKMLWNALSLMWSPILDYQTAWRWHKSLLLPPADTERLPPQYRSVTGWFREDWIHIKSNSKCTYLGTASSHYLLKSQRISKLQVHSLLWNNSHHPHSRYPAYFTSRGAFGPKGLVFTATVGSSKYLIWHS